MQKVKAIHEGGAVVFGWQDGCGTVWRDKYRIGRLVSWNDSGWAVTEVQFFHGEKVDDAIEPIIGTIIGYSGDAVIVEFPDCAGLEKPRVFWRNPATLRPHVPTREYKVRLTEEEVATCERLGDKHYAVHNTVSSISLGLKLAAAVKEQKEWDNGK